MLDGGVEDDSPDKLDGGIGDDTLRGYGGDDTYYWNVGGGEDELDEQGADTDDAVIIGGWVTAADPELGQQIGVIEHDDEITILRSGSGGVVVQTNRGTLTVDNIERLTINAGGGADKLTVNNIAGSDVSYLAFDLAAPAEVQDGDSVGRPSDLLRK